ncbi:MAG: hypothetical protein OEX23_15190 [Betaproteobacteria bacterium]|nr:hypothetical protein [Betaproteobacteria bacterium]
MARAWKRLLIALSAALAASGAGVVQGASTTVTVPGIADVWLAGQPNGTVLNGGFPGSDVAPTNSPVLASSGLNLAAGSVLTVSATGGTDYNGCPSTTPDAGNCGNANVAAAFGISAFVGPANSLIGVFLDASVPGGAAPAGLNFSTPGSLAQASIAPQLRQVFFIGDGRTGTGTGNVQQIVVPAGATRLFLGQADGLGANYNNFGSFNVTVTDSAAPAASTEAIPVDAPWALALTALLIAASFAWRRRATRRR